MRLQSAKMQHTDTPELLQNLPVTSICSTARPYQSSPCSYWAAREAEFPHRAFRQTSQIRNSLYTTPSHEEDSPRAMVWERLVKSFLVDLRPRLGLQLARL